MTLVSILNLTEDIYEHNKLRLGQITESFIAYYAKSFTLDGVKNETRNVAFVAGGLGPNLNILSYGES